MRRKKERNERSEDVNLDKQGIMQVTNFKA